MSVEAIIARISALDSALTGRAARTAAVTGGASPAAVAQASSVAATLDPSAQVPAPSLSFASLLAAGGQPPIAGALPGVGSLGMTAGVQPGAGAFGTPAQIALAAAQAEVGQAEQPPGSNDSPRIAEYRQSTAGAGIGPWCAYFVSWAARQAGTPLGESGQGFGSVPALSAWAQRTGRFVPAAGARPNPGDLIVWGGEHVGMVESVDPDGTVHTIEGNSSNMVARRTHDASGDGATGYVRMS